MSWHESKPGHHTRPLSGAEQGMIFAITAKQSVTREHIRIHAFADFTALHPPATVVAAFRDAWKALRLLKSPDIAATFEDGNKHYDVPSAEEVEVWIDRTFRVAPSGESAQSVVRKMQERLELLPVFYVLPRSTEGGTEGTVILFISHWRTEAAGSFKIISDLFDFASELLSGSATKDALSNYRPGDEVKLLTPTMEDILMPNRSSAPESKKRIEKYFTDYDAKLPALSYPLQGSLSAVPSSVKLNLRTYTTTATSSVARACKAKGISVTAAIHSAYVEAARQVAEPDQKTHNYAIMMPAQVRTRLPPSSPYRDQGCWNASQMLLLTAPAGQDYLARARGLKEQYSLADQPTWLYEDARAWSEEMRTHPLPYAVLPWITSHGVLDREIIPSEHGELRIEKVMVFADPAVTPGIVFGVWTFKGKLNLEIHWNTAFHDDDVVQRTLDLIDATLEAELGVKMDVEEAGVTEF